MKNNAHSKSVFQINIIQKNKLSKKLSNEFVIPFYENLGNADPVDIISTAYNKAVDLFNPDSPTSIITFTLKYYYERIDEILNDTFADMDDFKAISILLPMAFKIQSLINKGSEEIREKFSSDLINNKDYYMFFDIDYYFELSRISGLESALKELEEDINIKANTYYNFAYNEYLDLLPYFKLITNKD